MDGVGEMAQQSKALAAFMEDPGFISTTSSAAHNHL